MYPNQEQSKARELLPHDYKYLNGQLMRTAILHFFVAEGENWLTAGEVIKEVSSLMGVDYHVVRREMVSMYLEGLIKSPVYDYFTL